VRHERPAYNIDAIMTHTDSPNALRVSVLDQSPIAEGTSGAAALQNSIDLAQLADELGFHRYWVAEHHGSPALACASPEVLIGPIAASTRRIRVGSGGIMLPHYSPLKVAENFSMLAGLFPDRIDLGIGRAAGTDALNTFALQRDRRQASPDDFFECLQELLGYLDRSMPPDHPFIRFSRLLPGRPDAPVPYLLGSSPQSGIWAAELGLPYVFADFINAGGAVVAKQYRAAFQPAGRSNPAPHTIVAVSAICAPTDEEALELSASHRMLLELLHRGQLIAVPSVERASRYFAQQGRSPLALTVGRRLITGSPATARSQIEQVVEDYDADEVMVVTILHDHRARRRSYELIAEAFDLTAAPMRRTKDPIYS
jgi:luciferase family oxidoreductase group 1